MKKLVMVDCVSMFLNRYCVEVEDNIDHALDTVVMYEHNPDVLEEFSQEYIGNNIISHREISKEEYIKIFDKDNDYLSDWTEEQKFSFITRIEETE